MSPSSRIRLGPLFTVTISLSVFLSPAAALDRSDRSVPQSLHPDIKHIRLKTSVLPGTDLHDPVAQIITDRMADIGYIVTSNPIDAAEAEIHLDCTQPVIWTEREIPRSSSPYPSEPQGPPCLLSYTSNGRPTSWNRVHRVLYSQGVQVMNNLLQNAPPLNRRQLTLSYLRHYDFPVLLTAEWGEVDRLIKIARDPTTSVDRQRFVIFLLGEIQATQALPYLLDSLPHSRLTVAAARALGHFGESARNPLIDLLQHSSRPEVQAAAAYSLGTLGALTGTTHATPLLLEVLARPGIGVKLQTEIVWGSRKGT